MKRKYVKKAVSFGLAAVTALVLAGPAAGSPGDGSRYKTYNQRSADQSAPDR